MRHLEHDVSLMPQPDEYRLPPGRQPYDALNGLRVGALAGAVLGFVIAVLSPLGAWVLFVTAAVGAAVGYWSERRSLPPR